MRSTNAGGPRSSTSPMPFVLAGRGGGRVDTGRLLDLGGRRHGGLFASVARATGHDIDSFGDTGERALPGLVG